MPDQPLPLVVLGAGAWGTALAIQCARLGHPTRLWGPNAASWAKSRCNQQHLPGIVLPDALTVYDDLAVASDGMGHALVAVPSHAFEGVLTALKPHLPAAAGVLWGTKGFDLSRGVLLETVAKAVLGESRPLAVLSGPSFAMELAKGLPTAVDVASHDAGFLQAIQGMLHGPQFALHPSADTIGVAMGGAVKNIIAIAVGMSDGLQLGANARSALITRGLHEMTELGVAMGAKQSTFMGLSGMGDLVLTCSDNQSRNRSYGLALGQGVAQNVACGVVEGKQAVLAACGLAKAHRVSMPIVQMVRAVLYEGRLAELALQAVFDAD